MAPTAEEADMVALLEAHLRGDEAAINNLIDATNECDLFEATVGFLVAAFGEDEVAAVLNEWRRALSVRLSLPSVSLHAESRAANAFRESPALLAQPQGARRPWTSPPGSTPSTSASLRMLCSVMFRCPRSTCPR